MKANHLLQITAFALFLICLPASVLNAQKKSNTRYYRHEVNLSIGGMNVQSSTTDGYEYQLMDKFNLVPAKASYDDGLVGWSDGEPDLSMASTLMTLGYYYHINERIALGGYFSFVKVEDELGWEEPYVYDHIDGYPLTWTGFSYVKGKSVFLMPSFKWSWLNNRWCSLYSKVSCGLNYMNLNFKSDVIPQEKVGDLKDNNSIHFAYTLTPFGWEIGKQKVRWFMEWGFGSNFNFKMGLTYRFERFK
jgi:hypothetical protein